MRTKVLPLKRLPSKDKKTGMQNGHIISLWKDWEQELPLDPKQVYLNVCDPGQTKGPHLHKQRSQQYACIMGTGRVVVKYGPEDYEEIDILADKEPCVVVVPAGTPSAIQNTGSTPFIMINMPNPSWHPDNQDDHPVEFDDYEWKS